MTDESMSYLEALKEIKRLKKAWEKVKCEFSKKEKSDNWVHPEDSLIWQEAIEIIDKHLKEVENETDN